MSAAALSRPAVRAAAIVAVAVSLLLAALWAVAEHGRADSALLHETLPYYASADLQPRWDWLSSQREVGRFHLRDQDDAPLTDAILDAGPTVVSFFFTACVTVCPVSTEMLMHAQRSTQARFLSISVTPQADDARALRTYAATTGLPPSWRLATGAPADIIALARRGFYSDVASTGADGLPAHLNRAFLVDREHRLRGVYDASLASDILRLEQDLARL